MNVSSVDEDYIELGEDTLTIAYKNFGFAESGSGTTGGATGGADNVQLSEAAEAVMAQSYDAEVLKSDVVQVAHHCFNLLKSIYNLADAPIALMPNSYNGSHQPENLVKLDEVLKHVKDDQIYYEDSRTVGLAVEDGEMRVIYDNPTFSEEYDFSRF